MQTLLALQSSDARLILTARFVRQEFYVRFKGPEESKTHTISDYGKSNLLT